MSSLCFGISSVYGRHPHRPGNCFPGFDIYGFPLFSILSIKFFSCKKFATFRDMARVCLSRSPRDICLNWKCLCSSLRPVALSNFLIKCLASSLCLNVLIFYSFSFWHLFSIWPPPI